jgi:hypothetical protein
MRIYYPLTIQSQDDYLQRTPGNDMFRTPFGCRTVVRNFSGMRAQSSTSSVVIRVICAPNRRVVFIDCQEWGVGQRRYIKRHDRDGGEEWRSSPRSQ